MYKLFILYLFVGSAYSQITQQWVSYYNGPGPSNLAGDIVLASATDADGNTYVTGRSANQNFPAYGFDIATVKFNSAGVIQWSTRFSGPQNRNDQGHGIAVDGSGNVYVTGYTETNSSDAEMITIKYNSAGVQQWTVQYSSTYSTAKAFSIALDNLNNVYITGWCDTLNGGLGVSKYTTIKYNNAGALQWVRKYDFNNGGSEAVAVKTDSMANVYVTGRSFALGSTQWDYATIKYNSNGVQQWVSRFTSANSITDDEAAAMSVDNLGNVYVTGKGSFTSGAPFDYVTVKYNSSGAEQWNVRYNGPGNQSDIANCISIDPSGNIYTGGGSWGGAAEGYDFAVVKYNSAGIQQWAARNNYSSSDYVYTILTDNLSNIYVSGYDGAYKTIKYNSNGTELWNVRFTASTVSNDYYPILGKDLQNNIYISGSSIQSSQNYYDYTVIKYSQSSGIQLIGNNIPDKFFIGQNFPNPFNPVTKIKFDIPFAGNVSLKVYDIEGYLINIIIDGYLRAGTYEAEFDGSRLSSGVYFYTVSAGKHKETKKMILLK